MSCNCLRRPNLRPNRLHTCGLASDERGRVQVTALFFALFVLSGVITENVFELFAAAILDALVLARVLFYVIAKKNKHFRGRLVMLGFITGFQVIVLVRDRRPLRQASRPEPVDTVPLRLLPPGATSLTHSVSCPVV